MTSNVQQVLLVRMVTEYGMSDKLGPMQFGQAQGGQVFLGRDFNSEQNYSVMQLLMKLIKKCKQLLKSNMIVQNKFLTEKRDMLRFNCENVT